MTQQFTLASLFAQFGGQAPELPQTGFEPLDIGNYRVSVDSVETRTFKDGAGTKLTYTCTIVEGKSLNRKIWLDFVVNYDEQPEMVMRGLRDLYAFTLACGLDLNAAEIESHIGTYPVLSVRYFYSNKSNEHKVTYDYVTSGGKLFVVDGKFKPAPENAPQAEVAPQAAQPAARPDAPWLK